MKKKTLKPSKKKLVPKQSKKKVVSEEKKKVVSEEKKPSDIKRRKMVNSTLQLMEDPTTITFVLRMDRALHKAVKEDAKRQSKSMNLVICERIEDSLNQKSGDELLDDLIKELEIVHDITVKV